jgi:putative (di)nucleoside polyphosphate hydrolase
VPGPPWHGVATLDPVNAPHFRAGVVMVVRRGNGDLLAFERGDVSGAWQLPQGGLRAGETPVQAAWRELGEETGLGEAHVRLAGEHPRWTVYELPAALRTGNRLGQAHRWFFFDALDDELTPTPDQREFVGWAWFAPADLIAAVVDFRRPNYEEVLGAP